MFKDDHTLRLHIAEKWEPQDYISAISAIETLYYVTLFGGNDWRPQMTGSGQGRIAGRMYRVGEDLAEYIVEEARATAGPNERLIIQEIRHSSPGFIDFEGLGDVAKAIDNSLGRIIQIFTERRLRRELDERAKVETDIRRENLNTLKIQNARELLELRADFPGHRTSRQLERALVDQQTKIEALAAQGLITDRRDHGR